ncbi:hypothetical protein MMC29_004715 [Sticta canariensis]|nr:hypothetical protein [Sticta canariensis]
MAKKSATEGLRSHPIDVDKPDKRATLAKPKVEQQQHDDMTFSADGRYLNFQVYVADGHAKVPVEALEVIGTDLHFTAIVGRENINSEAPDLGFDAEAIVSAAEEHRGAPLAIMVNSQHLGAELSGWQTGGGALQLRKPASAHIDFTPALAK